MFALQEDMQHSPVDELGDRKFDMAGGRLALFSSHDLAGRTVAGPAEAIVVVHGALRNAGVYYRSVLAAAEGHDSQPVVVAPQFLTEVDVRDRPERIGLLHWDTEDWKGGLGRLSSFEVMDALLDKLCGFPGLRRVTIVGNSAGGQFVNRYAAVGRGLDRRHIAVRYIISNPSTYLYFDRDRHTGSGFARHEDPQVDQWRYGFTGRLPGYVSMPAEKYFERYVSRDVIYLLGNEDCDPGSALLEVHPAAAVQGRTRLERGERYYEYLEHKAGRPVHRMMKVPGVGHNACDVFASEVGREILFGDTKSGSYLTS